MQVSVQKSTRTTRPRSPAGSSGSELSHPVAPPNEGMCSRRNRVVMSAPSLLPDLAVRVCDGTKTGRPLPRVAPVEDTGSPLVPGSARAGAAPPRSARRRDGVLGGQPGCAPATGRLTAGDGGRRRLAGHPGGGVRLVLAQRLPLQQRAGQPVEPLTVAPQRLDRHL